MPNPYEFSWDGESYNFTTDLDVKYRVVFDDPGDLFSEYPSINGRVFSFAFYASYNELLPIRQDLRVKDTIADIINKFFVVKTNMIVFVCDSTDGRELCRKRLFERWFEEFNDNILEKYDGTVADGAPYSIRNSIIFRSDLEDKEHVIKVFTQLNDKFSSAK